jgi:hypothetical protein
LRFLWSEAAIHAVRRDLELKQFYRRKLIQKDLGKARAAVARKLGIRMWIMLRDHIEYNEFCRRGQMHQKNGDACAGNLSCTGAITLSLGSHAYANSAVKGHLNDKNRYREFCRFSLAIFEEIFCANNDGKRARY